ncbi:MAG: helix-turn-helix domain-containing protein [Alphaproteobacteria bacterium]|jgi:DNA-binding Xre family transcriptional regulator|nr:helix-turn-helix domain-containing protein [Alphaproteobacteria bacterium]
MARAQKITKSNLTPLLKEKGHTFKELAEYLGVSTQQAQKYGNGSNELSLKLLMETCKFLDCYPEQIYPEIEMYDKGFHVPKTGVSTIEDSEKNVTINNNTTNIYKSNIFEDFFSNVRLLDVNQRGALLLKIAVFIIALDLALYFGFRTFGFSYAPFIGGNDHLGQIMWSYIMFAWPLGFILPLVIKHWSVYIITLNAINSMLRRLLDITGITDFSELSPNNVWLIKALVALVLTLGYAWIVKTYLRKPTNTKAKTA